MGNIIGEGFPKQIIEQVKTRQEKYGSKTRNNEIQTFLNSQTGWVRLSSSVDVKVDARKLGLLGPELAKQYVLFNGSSKYTNTGDAREIANQRSGVASDLSSIHGNFAYGIGGNEMGLSPMPGITAMSTKTETRGSLKTSTIQIKCHNRIQFDIIDTLYLRLGFTMLLEWGNSSYFNNKGEYIKDNPYNLTDDFLGIGKKITYSKYYPEIEKRRLLSNGNYDAVMGKVVNFNWSFNKDGSYDVTVVLRSMGDVIESLRTNILLADKFDTNAQDAEIVANYLQAQRDVNNVEDIFITKSYEDPNGTTQYFTVENPIQRSESTGLKPIIIAPFKSEQEAIERQNEQTEGTEAYEDKQAEVAAEGTAAIYAAKDSTSLGRWIYESIERFQLTTSSSTNGISRLTTINNSLKVTSFIRQKYFNAIPPHYFISFKRLLDWVQNNIIPRTNNQPLFNIDTNPETNIIVLAGRQVPTDNAICQVAYTQEFSGGQILYYLGGGGGPSKKSGETFEITKGDNRYGKIMNIYFNINFVLNSLKESSTDGKVTLIDFLTKLCDGWNSTTGNYSKLEPTFVEETNTLRFTDENQLPDRDAFLKDSKLYNPPKSTELTYFNIYGYYPQMDGNSTAGFVSDFSFETSISPNLATMITIGANNNGQITGEDATGVSRMNNGYKDRIKPIITSPGISNDEAEAASVEDLEKSYTKTLTNLTSFLSSVGSLNNVQLPTYDLEIIAPFKTCIKTLIEFDQSKKTQNKNLKANEDGEDLSGGEIFKNNYATASTGFLPFNLSLTMDGLSGMKIYQKFITDTSFLPSNYPSSLEFLISGITNTIVGNKWETKIESIAVPKNPFSPKSDVLPVYQERKRQGTGVTSTGSVEKLDKTITSGFPIKSTSYSNKTYRKNAIMVHYTADWQRPNNAKATIDYLNDNTNSGLSYHYIIDGVGHREQIVPNNVRAYHAGADAESRARGNISANTLVVGISLQNIGFKRNDILDKNGNLKQPNQEPLVQLVNWNNEPITYRGHSFAQEVTDGQIAELKKLLIELQADSTLDIPTLTWNGKETYEQLFPPVIKGVKTLSYNKSKPGLYTHCSSNKEKADCLPTPKLINLFKSFGGGMDGDLGLPTIVEMTEEGEIALITIASKIVDIFTRKDSEGVQGAKLLQPAKGVNDDEELAVLLFNKWLNSKKILDLKSDIPISDGASLLYSWITKIKSNIVSKGSFSLNYTNLKGVLETFEVDTNF